MSALATPTAPAASAATITTLLIKYALRFMITPSQVEVCRYRFRSQCERGDTGRRLAMALECPSISVVEHSGFADPARCALPWHLPAPRSRRSAWNGQV